MFWLKKVDNRKYLLGSVINLSFSLYSGWPRTLDCALLCYMVIGAALNHYFTIQVFSRIVENNTNPERGARKANLIFNIILKFFFLMSAFVALLTFAKAKVLQGLFIYIFQLIILFLSIKNIGLLIKKGPSE